MKKLTVLAIILMVVSIGFLSGCTSSNIKTDSDFVCPEGTLTCFGVNQYKCISNKWVLYSAKCDLCGYTEPIPDNDDLEFLEWFRSANEEMLPIINKINYALGVENWHDVRDYSDLIERIAERLKIECGTFSLSYECNNIRDFYYLCLEELSHCSFYYKCAAQEMLDGKYYVASESLRSGTRHLNLATNYLNYCNSLMDV